MPAFEDTGRQVGMNRSHHRADQSGRGVVVNRQTDRLHQGGGDHWLWTAGLISSSPTMSRPFLRRHTCTVGRLGSGLTPEKGECGSHCKCCTKETCGR